LDLNTDVVIHGRELRPPDAMDCTILGGCEQTGPFPICKWAVEVTNPTICEAAEISNMRLPRRELISPDLSDLRVRKENRQPVY
jgi:hypothetical protein